jgi:hypothetical protein
MSRPFPLDCQPIRDFITSSEKWDWQILLGSTCLDTALVKPLEEFVAVPATCDYCAWGDCKVVGAELGV